MGTAPDVDYRAPGAGLDGADRVTLIWADGAIRNRWLQVTVLATDNTGLAANDVFYLGNAVGESGNSPTDALVNATDEIGARNNPHGPFTPAPRMTATTTIATSSSTPPTRSSRNNRTSPFTALKLITPPLEDDGSGEGEGEWSGDVWTTWTDSSLFESTCHSTTLFRRQRSCRPSPAATCCVCRRGQA